MSHGCHGAPLPALRGIQQSVNMLRNRSTLLKLDKTILITFCMTSMCTMSQRQQCGCRQWCLQPRMGRLRQLRRNRFVLWTYWHHPVAWFPWRRWGRRSKHGRRGGNLGFVSRPICCVFELALEVVAELGYAIARSLPVCMLLLRAGGEGSRGTRGIGKVTRLIVF